MRHNGKDVTRSFRNFSVSYFNGYSKCNGKPLRTFKWRCETDINFETITVFCVCMCACARARAHARAHRLDCIMQKNKS